ncbi:MAG TPA: hypothetical protein VKE94_09005 [Gemmataceae bacterium]|nr:hypothetical protein [Gemmataceae bacterium]
MSRVATAILAFLVCAPLPAQWLHYPTPGVPRTKEGKANLSAPAPKTIDGKPDLSGIWASADNKYLQNLAADGIQVPFQPWAEKLYKERSENLGKGRPSERCLTHGVTDFDALGINWKMIQTPGVIAILYEAYNHYRQIFLDGRPLPKPTQPAYLGYSVGKWESDTLVVDTTGFNDQGWLDDGGHLQAESLHGDRALPPPRFRPHGPATHHRRPKGLYEGLGTHAPPQFPAGRRDHGIHLREREGRPTHGG